MIELTSGYKSAVSQKFLLNPLHITYVASCKNNESYENVNCYIEYSGSPEIQYAYIQETYEEIKEMLK